MNRSDCIRELLLEYQALRVQNEQALDARIEEAGRIDPEIARMREENASLALETLKRILTLEDEAARREAAEQMKQRGIFNNHEIRRRLVKAGLPENYLDLHYRCPVCKDTGYVGEAPSRFCECFEKNLRMKQFEDGSMAGVREQNFDTFDPNYIPEENGQRALLLNVRDRCEQFADKFPNLRILNLVLSGTSGLGKTFLLNCIYERVISRGQSALRVSAYRMFEAMRKQHLSNSADEQNFQQLIDAPLLLIDDLGSEPMMRNITVEYLFTLLNERLAAKRHTVVATNMTRDQIMAHYGERVASRLLGSSHTVTYELEGKDLRQL